MPKPITERPIHIYTCMKDPSRKPIAMIEGFPMTFKGDTPMQVRRKADEWRRRIVQQDKLLTKAQKAELLGEDVA